MASFISSSDLPLLRTESLCSVLAIAASLYALHEGLGFRM